LALLGARVLQVSPDSLRHAVWITAPIAAGLGVFLIIAGDSAAALIREAPGVAEAVRAISPFVGAGLIATAVLALSGLRRRGLGFAGLALMPLVVILGSRSALVALGEQRSAHGLAESILAATQGQGRVVGVGAYAPSLSFYLERTVLLPSYDATELKSNYIKEYREALSATPDSNLRPLHLWVAELDRCEPGTVFLLNAGSPWEKERALVSAELPLLYRNHNYEAYGPCGAGDR